MRTTAILVSIGLTLGLAGCAGQPADSSTPAGDPQGEAAPHPLLDVACDELVDDDMFVTAYGEVLPERAPYVEGYGGMGNVATAALTLAGATRCAWGDDTTFLEIDVLPAAQAEWARLEDDLRMFQPQEGTHGEGAWYTCHPGDRPGCRADVLAGGHWVAVNAQRMLDTNALDALLSPLVAGLTAREASAPDWPAPAVIPADCATLLPLEAVRAAIGDDVEVWADRGAVLSQTLRQAALDRVGAVHCAWRNGFGSATARTVDLTVMPGGGLVWAGHFAAPLPEWVERAPLDLGDAGFSAAHTSVFTGVISGVASTLAGDTWVDVWANDEARDDDVDIAVALARDAVESLGS
jgi:hypothetical protein